MNQIAGYATNIEIIVTNITVKGTIKISSFVLPCTSNTISSAIRVDTYEPMGLPGFPTENAVIESATALNENLPSSKSLNTSSGKNAPKNPATAHAKTTRSGAFSFLAIPTPMPAPISVQAMFPMRISSAPNPEFAPHQLPICLNIVPAISVTNSPCAIPENASMK